MITFAFDHRAMRTRAFVTGECPFCHQTFSLKVPFADHRKNCPALGLEPAEAVEKFSEGEAEV